jgi:2-dehydropantoate 2-reductase
MTDKKITWYILGAGAIGCLWASYFRLAGFPVILITPTKRSASCITLHKDDQQQLIDIEQITVSELLDSSVFIEHLLVTTKAQQTLPALTTIKNKIVDKATLLILQNGLTSTLIHELLPSQKLIAGITTDGAYRLDPMTVVHAGKGLTTIGCYNDQQWDHAILSALPISFLNIETTNDIKLKQWQKLAISCAVNGLTVIYRCRNGELLEIPEALKRMERICIEVQAVTHALELPDQAFSNVFQTAKETLKLTANNYSSMYQDIRHGRETEIDYINGTFCNQANSLAIACIENQAIINEIKHIQHTN